MSTVSKFLAVVVLVTKFSSLAHAAGDEPMGRVDESKILSLNACMNLPIDDSQDEKNKGTVRFHFSTSPAFPHYVFNGKLYADGYITDKSYTGGNHYNLINPSGDAVNIYISRDDRSFTGDVLLAAQSVLQIQQKLKELGDSASEQADSQKQICIDGVKFEDNEIHGTRIAGEVNLMLKGLPIYSLTAGRTATTEELGNWFFDGIMGRKQSIQDSK